MSPQFVTPSASQRRQRYANAIDASPSHVPGSASSVSPSRGVPETVGGAVSFGAERSHPVRVSCES